MSTKWGGGFACATCGHTTRKWMGRCPQCGEWNTLQEAPAHRGGSGKTGRAGAIASTGEPYGPTGATAVPMSRIEVPNSVRLPTGMGELDRVLGGGFILGTSALVGGEPGIGKSTLMLQAACLMPRDIPALYVSGEEAPGRIKQRAQRLGLDDAHVHVLCAPHTDAIADAVDRLKPGLVIVDSIQTATSGEELGSPGSPSQLKAAAYDLTEHCRAAGCALFLVAHVTKEGAIAGPRLVEHMVDAVLYFERADGDTRILRATKNRFGATDEIGIFRMHESGLKEVTDPSSLFLVRRDGPQPAGVVPTPIYEGTRVLVVEIQSLTVPAKSGVSRVFSDRIDPRRVSRVAAVLEKHLSIRLSDRDIYVNVAGGMRIEEVGVELPLAIALYSASSGLAIPREQTVTGELSLAGEVRPVVHLVRRARAAAELGYTRVVGPAPASGADEEPPELLHHVNTIGEAIRATFEAGEHGPTKQSSAKHGSR